MNRIPHFVAQISTAMRIAPVSLPASFLLAFALTTVTARDVVAQSRGELLFQVGAGIGYGAGGDDYRNRTGFAVDALVGHATPGARTRLLALQAAAQGWPGTGDSCDPTPSGACRENFPVFYSLTALVGRAWGRTSRVHALVLVGPGLQLADDGGSAFALSGKVLSGVRLVAPVDLTLSLNTSLLPNYRGDVLLLTSLGVGVSLRR